MKPCKFLVTFFTGQEEIVYAFDGESAKILAQAEQIKQGNDYQVEKILNMETGKYFWE